MTRLLFAVIALSAITLGYIGLRSYVGGAPDHKYGTPTVTNLLYYDIGLFLLQSTPADDGGSLPWQLEVARFAAASLIAYTVAEVGVVVSANRVRRTRLRRASGHAVVCGSTRAADFVAGELRRAGKKVVVIDERDGRPPERWLVAGDPSRPRTLLDAGVRRAATLYACLDESQRNAEIVSAAERIRAGRTRPEKIYAMIDDPELCVMLKARRWSLVDADLLHVDFFNPDELAAQAAVRRDGSIFEAGAPEIAIVGTSAFGRAVLVELARQWLLRRTSAGEPLRAVLVADDATDTASRLRQRYPFIDEACVLRTYSGSLPRMLVERQRFSAPRLRRVYLCQDEEGEALKAALTAVVYLRRSVESVVVRLDRLSGMAKTFEGGLTGQALLDALGGRLRVVDVIREGCDPANIGDDLAETLARASHQRYLTERVGDGAQSAPAVPAWEELPEDRRTANREQAIDIGRKLARIGCLLAPRSEAAEEFGYRLDEVERLARSEHERWMRERLRSGWTYGSPRDDAAKSHPDLVPWSRLPEQSRDKDRQAVRAIPGLLADVGLAVVRVSPA